MGEVPEDVPFAVPEKWKWVTLGTISKKIHYGYTASAKEKGNARLLRITDVQNGVVNWSSVPFCSPSDKEISKFKLNVGDIVIARTGGTIGKSYLFSNGIKENTVFASYLIRVIPELGYVNPAYLQNFLNSPCYWEQIIDGSRGTGQPNVNAQALSEIKIPLPSLEEQRRIVACIQGLRSYIESYRQEEQQLATLQSSFTEKLRSSILQEAIQGKLVPQLESEPEVAEIGVKPYDAPFAIPKKWKWVQLKTVGKIVGGGTPKTNIPDYWDNGRIPWFTPADLGKVSDIYVGISARKITEKGLANSSATMMPANSVLFSSRAPIGYIALAREDCCTNQGCKSFVANELVISSLWAYWVLKARTQDIIERASGTTFKEISGRGMGDTWIPLPPMEEQERIVHKIKELFNLVKTIQ
ncbi:restriction endonuclease subunit S [Parasutterella secunda]|uniref:restriction endonuclease subunit S n=1 Tax=Parasutterella secunda TaxID=626947 RepID=UPI0025A46A7B|nr:restriction endonuclease subunit S [Parasutterella secunda]MDM8088034.1 restriction endonuclease subunit S [Parasutterella secunda]